MPMVRAMRMLNAIEAGTLTGANFETLLTTDPGRLAEFNALLGMRGQARRMAASNTSMTAVSASSTAINAVAASSTAMSAVAASGIAMTAVVASTTAMNAVSASSAARTAIFANSTIAFPVINTSNMASGKFVAGAAGLAPTSFADMTAVAASSGAMTSVAASVNAKLALYELDTATTACLASTDAMTALRAAATVFNKAANNTTNSNDLTVGVSPSNLINTGKYLLLGASWSTNNVGGTMTFSTRRSGSTRPNQIAIGSGGNTTASTLACTPLTGPLSFASAAHTIMGYFSFLRCDV